MEKSSVVFLLAGLIEPLGPDMPEQECERIILYYVAALVLVAQASSGSAFKTDERFLALDSICEITWDAVMNLDNRWRSHAIGLLYLRNNTFLKC